MAETNKNNQGRRYCKGEWQRSLCLGSPRKQEWGEDRPRALHAPTLEEGGVPSNLEGPHEAQALPVQFLIREKRGT